MLMLTAGPGPSQFVPGLALEILDEVHMRMMECRLALQALSEATGLDFDGLEQDLHAAQQSARRARQAAGLARPGAAPDPQSATDSAVPSNGGCGAADGMPMLGDHLERALWRPDVLDCIENVVAVRPKCSGTVRLTGAPCTQSAVHLGSGRFGMHCRLHAIPTERSQLTAHREKVTAELARSHDELGRRRRRVGDGITEHWLQHRQRRREWVGKLTSATRNR
ncbi:hypothetical protein A5722_32305 [Mycobacterium vulneris]|nr:hypothetical protein A5722_32305 [Mycolicibacterium vulneris]OCB67829.1 hypothetical protein A5729_06800 [Mycolicibacterium vulneris]